MVFDSDCSVSFKPLLEYVLGLDHTGQVQWTNLNSVTVITRQKTTEDGIPTIYEPNDTVIFSVTGLAKMLTSRISKLQKLNLKFDNNAYMTSYISDKLIQKYQSSLIDASITNSIIVSPKTYMSNIVNLNLHYSRTAVPILPKINPVTIQSLSLIDIPLTFTWDDIIPEDIEGEVTFPNMHSLKIHIMDSHSSTDQTFVNSSIDKLEEPRVGTVNLPKLKNIHIQNYPIRLVYTTTLVMDKMTQVSIHNGVLGVDYTKGIRYNSVEKLSLKVVDSVDEECSSDLRAVKKMFSTKKATCSNELMVFHEKYQVDFTKYVLTNINTLMILQVDGHSYMMQLLKALPTLSKLNNTASTSASPASTAGGDSNKMKSNASGRGGNSGKKTPASTGGLALSYAATAAATKKGAAENGALGARRSGSGRAGSPPAQPLSSLVNAQLRLTLVNGSTVEGVLYTFDVYSGVLALVSSEVGELGDQLGVDGARQRQAAVVRLIKAANIRDVQVAGRETTGLVLPEVRAVSTAGVEARKQRAVEQAQERAAKIGVGVSDIAQSIFEALSRTLPCRWSQDKIVVLDEVAIESPYGVDDCRELGQGGSFSLQRVKKVLQGELNRLAAAK
ncbi:hypothetical protein GGI07_003061 [Coemansia sp. Benny D115]|nr:hypothetical protein GGI07_003061 [Coemansia sp. Benny D115]